MIKQEFQPITVESPEITALMKRWKDVLNDFVNQNSLDAGTVIGLLMDGIRYFHFYHAPEGYTDEHLMAYFKKFFEDCRAEERAKMQ
jgi:hypothetical protein